MSSRQPPRPVDSDRRRKIFGPVYGAAAALILGVLVIVGSILVPASDPVRFIGLLIAILLISGGLGRLTRRAYERRKKG